MKRAAIVAIGAEIVFAATFALAGVFGLSGHAQADAGHLSAIVAVAR